MCINGKTQNMYEFSYRFLKFFKIPYQWNWNPHTNSVCRTLCPSWSFLNQLLVISAFFIAFGWKYSKTGTFSKSKNWFFHYLSYPADHRRIVECCTELVYFLYWEWLVHVASQLNWCVHSENKLTLTLPLLSPSPLPSFHHLIHA